MSRYVYPKPELTQEYVRSVVDYDPETGMFTWKQKTGDKCVIGAQAGWKMREGYWALSFGGRKILGHRLAWLYMTGELPKYIDHIDLDRSNNAFSNLRAATHSQNLANSRKRKTNSTGYKGVYAYSCTGRKFEAKIMKDYKSIKLGVFDNPEDAHAAYCKAASKLFGEFARTE